MQRIRRYALPFLLTTALAACTPGLHRGAPARISSGADGTFSVADEHDITWRFRPRGPVGKYELTWFAEDSSEPWGRENVKVFTGDCNDDGRPDYVVERAFDDLYAFISNGNGDTYRVTTDDEAIDCVVRSQPLNPDFHF